MLKRFFKDSAIYWLGIVLSQGIGLILLPLYARVFSPENYGIIDILIIMAKFVNLTVALEISQGLARFYSDSDSRNAKIEYASTALWFTVIMYGFFVGVTSWLAAPLSALILGTTDLQMIFQVAIFSMGAEGVFFLIQNQLRFRLLPKAFAIVSLVNVLFSVGAITFLLLGAGLGVIAVFYGQIIGMIVSSSLAFYFAREDYRPAIDLTKLKEMLNYSIPLVPSSIGIFVVLYIDRIMIRSLMSLNDLGIYAVGFRIASIIMLLTVGVQAAITPLIYTHYREQNTPQELARIFRYFVAGALLMVIGLSIFAPEILIILTTYDYYSASILVPLLVPAVLLYRLYIFAPGLSIAKKTRIISVINLSGAGLNTILNFILIPYLGLSGAALATLVSAICAFGIHMIFSQKLYFVPHTWHSFGLAALFTIGIIWLGVQVDLFLWFNLIFKSILLCLAIGGFILLGLVSTEELKHIQKLGLSHLHVTSNG